MRPFIHYQAASVQEACELLKQYQGLAKVNAGGSDLLTVLRANIIDPYPAAVIDLKKIPNLSFIHYDGSELSIGALTTLNEICKSEIISKYYPALHEAAQAVASPQIRNVGTIGGNLCQDNRCWYYRYPDRLGGGSITCLRKGRGKCYAPLGDNRYHAIMGVKGCYAVCPSDTAIALTALDAQIVIASPEGSRKVPIRQFYHPLGNALKPDEIVTEIQIASGGNNTQSFIKHAQRNAIDFAIASAAAVLDVQDGQIKNASLVLGAIAPTPVFLEEASQMLIGKCVKEDLLEHIADLALAGSRPLRDNKYKVSLSKNLLKKVIERALEKA